MQRFCTLADNSQVSEGEVSILDEKLSKILNMLPQPVFLMKEGQILWCNSVAKSLQIEEQSLQHIFRQDPASIRLQMPESCLQLTVNISGQPYSATVQSWEDQLLVIASPIAQASAAVESLPFSDALRRPMQELITAAGTLFEELPEERSSRMTGAAAEVNRAIYQIQRLCTHTCEGGRLLSESQAAQRRSRNINELLDRFVESCRALVCTAGYDFRYTPMVAPVSADIDGQLIERALYQLLANAMTYTPKGGSIRLSCEKVEQRLLIRLADSGEGFRPDVMAALYGGSKSSSDPRSGVGIGLPVVKRIAELHGGSLHIESSDQGSTATLSLSLQRATLSLRSMRFHTDPYGGRSAALVELSGVLPSEFYDPEEIEA